MTDDSDEPFEEWLTDRLESARETYKGGGPRSENPRKSDIALGKVRAYRKSRTEYLNRNSPGEDGSGHGQLHFAYTTEPQSLETQDVKRIGAATILGSPAAIAVLGESHHVSIPGLGYHEVCSCAPVDGATEAVKIERDETAHFSFENDRVQAETVAQAQPLSEFPGTDGATVAYEFGNDTGAYTTIHAEWGSYETYHTYPERGIAFYTNTVLRTTNNDEEH